MKWILTAAAALMLAGPAMAVVVQLDSETGAIDTVQPTAVVSVTNATPTSESVVHFNVSFSESVGTTFDASAVEVTGTLPGTAAVSGSGPKYTVTLTLPSPNTGGLVGITVGNGVTDLAGNPCVVSSSPQYRILPAVKVPVAGLAALGGLAGLVLIGGARRIVRK